MKAISLWQPWASAMALGHKRVETRSWSTRYRGRLAIHAAKRWTREEAEFARVMGLPDNLPLGAVVAVGDLLKVEPTDKYADLADDTEAEWGNYSPGRYAWVFVNIKPLDAPIPFRGAQGFFNVPDALLGALVGGK